MKSPHLRTLGLIAASLFASVPSCNQTLLGTRTAVGNLLKQPLFGLQSAGNAITGNTYNSYARQTNETRRELPQSCSDIPVPEKGVIAKLWDSIRGVRDEVCTCRPWGTCPRSNCSCDVLCPDSFDIFSIHSERLTGGMEHELGFSNTRFAFKNYPLTEGYCWGHASITSKFNRLAFFKPDSRPRFRHNSAEWRDYYADLIDRIVDNETAEIPGFANLHDFSKHPTIQELLADKVAKQWADHAMSFNALGMALSSGKMDPRETWRLVLDIQNRIKMYQAPQIVFTRKDRAFATHAVLVHEVREQKKGVVRICLRENGSQAKNRGDCSSYIDRLSDGSLVGKPYGNIGGASIAANEDADTVEQLHSLRDRCERQKGCG